jgi:hypothetical protein
MPSTNLNNIGKRLYRSIPLIPVYCGLFIFIAVLSPMTWSASGINFLMLGEAAGLGIICAYCTTIFVEENCKKQG